MLMNLVIFLQVFLMMDTKEIIHYTQQIEKLHREGNYDSVLSLLKTFEGLQITVEQVHETGIAKVLFLLLKSCPVASVKKMTKCIFSKWKKQYGNSHHTVDNDSDPNGSLGEQRSSGRDLDTHIRDGATRSLREMKDDCECHQDTADDGHAISKMSGHYLVSSPAFDKAEDYDKCADEEKKNIFTLPKQLSEDSCGNSLISSVTSVCYNKNITPLRSKCSELIFQALSQNKIAMEKEQSPARLRDLACEIEEHIFCLHSQNGQKYKACVRCKVLNLRNPKSSDLLRELISGELSAEVFTRMSVLEMASKELKELRAGYTKSGIRQHQLPLPVEGTPTNKVRCRRCEGFNCSVTLISRSTLFLPVWEHSASPDDDTMTFITCKGCGEQWYHSGWVCL